MSGNLEAVVVTRVAEAIWPLWRKDGTTLAELVPTALGALQAGDCLPGGLLVVEAARMETVIKDLIRTSNDAVAALDRHVDALHADNEKLRTQLRGEHADH